MRLKNQVAVVTGGARGLGAEMCRLFAKEGAKVIAVDMGEMTYQAEGVEFYRLNITDPTACRAFYEETMAKYGQIDILVNNAGITKDGLVMRMSDADWADVIQTNLSSAFYWVKGLLRPMTKKRWGRIVNISSVTGVQGNAGQANYAAAKAGLIGLTKTLAREFATRAITVNAVAPGFITTDMTAALPEEVQQKIKAAIPLARFGAPEDIAATVNFLCSENAGYITGQCFSVDGGMAM